MITTQRPRQRTPRFPILTTKLFAPSVRTDTIPRPVLDQRLSEALVGRLTVISAPPGFGKTTAIVNWYQAVEEQGWRLGWVSLDAGDNDLARFLTYLIHGFKGLGARFGDDALAMLHSTQRTDWRVPLTILLNEIERQEEGPGQLGGSRLLLVLDDYHEIVEPEIHEAVMFLVEHLPHNARLMITSRAEPPLSLALLRARRDLTEIGIEQLRFTADEAASFLNGVMRLNLAPDQVEELERRTEGWIAGLLLAALSAGESDDPAAQIEAFGGEHHFVFDYLAEEVLNRQPEDVQEFLLLTSVLDRLSGPLCDAVTGRDDGREMLARLDDANLFVVRLDQSRTWYRYHHLFGEFLSSRLRRTDPARWREAHLRACDEYERQNLRHQAIDHALAVDDFERAAPLIAHTGIRTLNAGRAATLRRWFDALPEATIEAHTELAILRAWTQLMARQFEDVGRLIETLDRPGAAVLTPSLEANLAALRVSHSLLTSELERTVALGEAALPEVDPNDLFSRSTIAVYLGTAYRMQEELPKAVEMLTLGADLCDEADNIPGWLVAASQRAVAWMTLGDLRLAHDSYREVIDFERSHGLTNLGFAIASHLGLAEILREWNELDEADAVVCGALDVLDRLDVREEIGTRLYGLIIQIRVRCAQSRYDEALEICDRALAAAHAAGLGGWQLERAEAIRARVLLALGRVEEAAAWAGGVPRDEPSLVFHRELACQVLARIDVAQRRVDEALGLIDALRELAARGERRRRAIELGALEAVVREAIDDRPGACAALSSALRVSEPDGYIRVFADEGAVLASPLLDLRAQRPAHAGWSSGYLSRVIAAVSDSSMPGELQEPAVSPLAEPLSDREVEVLQLLAEGLSNQEVADQLFLSVGTVKRHTHNIYVKLGVANRTQAILRGQELNLVR